MTGTLLKLLALRAACAEWTVQVDSARRVVDGEERPDGLPVTTFEGEPTSRPSRIFTRGGPEASALVQEDEVAGAPAPTPSEAWQRRQQRLSELTEGSGGDEYDPSEPEEEGADGGG